MLLRVTIDEIEQRCDACGARRTLPLATLQAGVEHGEPPQPMDPSVIALPVCPGCDAREFLMRVHTPASPPEAATRGAAAEHRRGVNAAHHALIAAGRAAPSLARYFAEESVTFERGDLPWTFTGEPSPIVRRADPSTTAFSRFLAARNGGG